MRFAYNARAMRGVRTHPGITRRILIAFVLLTLLPAGAIALLGMRTVGKVIDQRLVRERATNAAALMSQMRLPPTALMMKRLSEMFGHEDQVAAEKLDPNAPGAPLESSMSASDQAQFAAQLHREKTAPDRVQIRNHTYVLGSADIRYEPGQRTHRLYLLVDQHVLDDAKAAAVRPLLLGAIPALLAVLAAAFYISRTITAPIRRLSVQIEAQIPGEDRRVGVPAHDHKDEGGRMKDESDVILRGVLRPEGSGREVDIAPTSDEHQDSRRPPGNWQLTTGNSSPQSAIRNPQSAIPTPPLLTDVELDAPRELADLASTFNRMLGRLRQTQQRLLEASRLAAVGKIAASVAHEVRNPLAGIRMNLQLLQQHLARAGKDDESLNIAISELDRLDSIVQEMLILGRQSEPRLETIDLNAIAHDVLHLLDRRLRHANVQPATEGQPAPALADPAQIKQVILNLVINALDAMPQGGRLILRTSSADQFARLEIDDTGTGLNLAPGEDPFAWFSTSKSAGSGIGLAVCKQIIDAHAGRIGLGRLDSGTRAWIELPRGPAH